LAKKIIYTYFLIFDLDLGFHVLGILGFTFVFDISGVSVFVCLVGDDLSAAIGEGDAVRSSNDIAISVLFVIEVVVGFFILNFVAKAVRLRNRGLSNR
jgi:hypothetical protein